ncbi:sigma-E factor negative regulatory protein [Parapusillimonas granuli]|uniref:Sigma-E factor negative regulatory protein n=1 Tax=Parapusillimonas granuli TaxID=380911 RepID=A0A853G744_9BURK|nr:sigma-E factor negative regulatory protein [Parapusillimonas granuli]MBB5216774.1 sigma-E factor negative regulatory protein RseA [Parapusillimonas granuli]MEB2400103.1 sigma-E factor negative regulatory protein [Alcaligenaceae bacterium]NYT51582.1 sigma-E factor negative regulatory protein [Parapusillimonas granuli]
MQYLNRTGLDQGDDQPSWEASVSSWIDGEDDIRPEELDTPYGRQVWDTYHLIGDVLRTQDLAIKPSDFFYARVSKAIDAEPPIVAPRNLRRGGTLRIGLSGLAVAAAVATVVWVALPYVAGEQSAPAPATQLMANAEEPSGLGDYLDAHREIAGVNPIRQASFEVRR